MNMSTAPCSIQPSTSDRFTRISDIVTQFTSLVHNVALAERVSPMPLDTTVSARVEHLSDEMLRIVNVATDVEEKLAQVMLLRQYLHVEWTQVESDQLEKMSRTEAHRYMPVGAKVASVIRNHKDLWETLQHANTAVELGKRAVDQLTRLEKAASRAAGILLGPNA